MAIAFWKVFPTTFHSVLELLSYRYGFIFHLIMSSFLVVIWEMEGMFNVLPSLGVACVLAYLGVIPQLLF